ncbi:hypothetical protein C489_13086 [Natrinema versiforme JCM 10478]|uniref:Uncharacterized protein n=1 Tax=Natrinema versiforme JCM 10478 TaxID=1227496 RepID=L9XXR2_9EURY|nr:hypothetical protein C489_13086 [Natrinema versiforme JCM 10478]
MKPIHDQMTVVLPKDAESDWLTADPDTCYVKCKDCDSELNVEQEKLTTCPHCYGELKEIYEEESDP